MHSVTVFLVAATLIQVHGFQSQHPIVYLRGAQEPQGQFFEEPHAYYLEPLVRHRRQLFGGTSPFGNGGFSQTVGYRGGPAWASMSQTHDAFGFSKPISFSGGADYTSPAGHGGAGSITMTPGIGGSASVRGQLGLLNTPNHQVTGWAEHSRSLDQNFKLVGPETNSGGLTYTNLNNGAGASVSATHIPGQPTVGSISGNIPLYTSKDGQTSVQASGSSSFAHGMKPDHQVGVKLTHNF